MGSGASRGAAGLKGRWDGPVGAGMGSRGAGPVRGGLRCSPRQAEGGTAGHPCGVGRDAEASL